jgi:hypothetical protein
VTAAIKKSLKREPHEWKMDTIYTMSFYTQVWPLARVVKSATNQRTRHVLVLYLQNN